MRAMVVTAPSTLEERDMPVPVLKTGEALIKIAYTGICGSDVHVYKGETPTAKKDVITGHEYSGVIEAIAPGSQNPAGLKPGDKVVGWIVEACGVCDACLGGHTNLCRNLKCYGTQVDGTFREYISAPLSMLYKIPDDADLRLYALVEPMAVAIYAVREAPLQLGDTALVIGGGAIGMCTAIAARMAGASKVAVSEIEAGKIARIQRLGFDVINPRECDGVQRVRQLTDGHGFNCVFEASGTPAGYELLTKAGSYRAKGVNIGMNFKPSPLITRDIMVTEMRIQAIRIHQQSVFGLTANMFAHLSEQAKQSLYTLISDDYDFEHLKDAFEFCVNDRSYCKVMVKISG